MTDALSPKGPRGSNATTSAAWQLSAASRHQDRDSDSDEEQQRKNRRRRRKPLPPLDLLGISNTAPAYGSGAFPAFPASQHASAFSIPKTRYHHAMAEEHQLMGTTMMSPPMNVTTGMGLGGSTLTNLGSPGVSMSPPQHGALPSLPKRAISPSLQNPLAAAPSSSRTVTVCCCIQVQFEGGARRCSRTFLWLVVIMSLICVFSIVTVLLSYYSVDVFQAKSGRISGSSGLFKKLNNAFSSTNAAGDSWVSSWPSASESTPRFDPFTALTNVFEPEDLVPSTSVQDFIVQSTLWSREHLRKPPANVLSMYGTDFVNPRAVLPDAKVYFVMNTFPCPTVSAIKACDVETCQKQVKEFIAQSFKDLDKEGFVTANTASRFSPSNPLGILPALLASIKAIQAEIVSVEDSPADSGLSCLKFALQQSSDEFVMIYCGDLDESSEPQRASIRSVLKPLHPVALFVRAANYALFPDVRPQIVPVALTHFKAMLLALSSVVIQDDSGLPLAVLSKHSSDLMVWGEYRGLGDPELSQLQKVPGTVVKQLYQVEMAQTTSAGPLPFKFGYRNVIGPQQPTNATASGTTEADARANVFVKRSNFKGSHIIVAKKK